MFGKDQLFVDLTDIADSDKVISFLRSANDKNITSTTVGGKEALDVFVANSSANPLPVAPASFVNLQDAAVVVGVTAVKIPSTALASRRSIQIENLGTRPIFLGASGVTVATGVKVNPGSVWEQDCGATVDVYGISSIAAQDVRVIEFA
jgi:hypothetical protein